MNKIKRVVVWLLTSIIVYGLAWCFYTLEIMAIKDGFESTGYAGGCRILGTFLASLFFALMTVAAVEVIFFDKTAEEMIKSEAGILTEEENTIIKSRIRKSISVQIVSIVSGFAVVFLMLHVCISTCRTSDAYFNRVKPTIAAVFQEYYNELEAETQPLKKVLLYRQIEPKLRENTILMLVEYDKYLFKQAYQPFKSTFDTKYRNLESDAEIYFSSQFQNIINGPEELAEDLVLAKQINFQNSSSVIQYIHFCNQYLNNIKKFKDKINKTRDEQVALKRFVITNANSEDPWIVAALKQCIHEDMINQYVCQLPATNISM